MNKHNENKLSMVYAVLTTCLKYIGVWTAKLPFKTAHDELQANWVLWKDAAQKQEAQMKGVAIDKQQKRDAMEEASVKVADKVFAYAEDMGDVVLRERMNYSLNDLGSLRDALVAEVCQGIHDVANSLVANLAPYGVVPAELTAHQTVIDAYVTAVSAPRTAAIMRKGATSELTVMATKSMRILTNRMDKMMREFQTSDPVFYQEYFDARIIVDAGAAKKNVKKAADPNAKAA